MCAPALCMQSRWTPALIPLYRPPKVAGWTIRDMPEIFPEHMREAWHARKRQSNNNGHDAAIEMANFLKLNGVELTKEVMGAIRNQADDEWCTAEPSRCVRKARIGSATTPREATTAEQAPVKVRIVAVRTPKKAPARARGCCGGRAAR